MKFKKILVATDFSEASLGALETAFDLALQGGSSVYLVHVMDPYVIAGDPTLILHTSVEGTSREVRQRLEELIPQEWREDGDGLSPVVQSHVLEGSGPARAITKFAEEKDVDLVVLGTHGQTGLTRLLMGSTAESLLRYAPCPVLVVKQRTAAKVA